MLSVDSVTFLCAHCISMQTCYRLHVLITGVMLLLYQCYQLQSECSARDAELAASSLFIIFSVCTGSVVET